MHALVISYQLVDANLHKSTVNINAHVSAQEQPKIAKNVSVFNVMISQHVPANVQRAWKCQLVVADPVNHSARKHANVNATRSQDVEHHISSMKIHVDVFALHLDLPNVHLVRNGANNCVNATVLMFQRTDAWLQNDGTAEFVNVNVNQEYHQAVAQELVYGTTKNVLVDAQHQCQQADVANSKFGIIETVNVNAHAIHQRMAVQAIKFTMKRSAHANAKLQANQLNAQATNIGTNLDVVVFATQASIQANVVDVKFGKTMNANVLVQVDWLNQKQVVAYKNGTKECANVDVREVNQRAVVQRVKHGMKILAVAVASQVAQLMVVEVN